MRLPTKVAVANIVKRHRKKKYRVSKRAATEMYLFYLCFMKKLAKACDSYVLERNKVVVGEDIIRECAPKLLKRMSMIETMKTTLPPSLVKEMSDHSSGNDSDLEDDELTSDEE